MGMFHVSPVTIVIVFVVIVLMVLLSITLPLIFKKVIKALTKKKSRR